MTLADLLMEHGVLKNADAQKLAQEIEARFAKEGFIRVSELDKTINALKTAEKALRRSYDVMEYPGNGTSEQDVAADCVECEIARLETIRNQSK